MTKVIEARIRPIYRVKVRYRSSSSILYKYSYLPIFIVVKMSIDLDGTISFENHFTPKQDKNLY